MLYIIYNLLSEIVHPDWVFAVIHFLRKISSLNLIMILTNLALLFLASLTEPINFFSSVVCVFLISACQCSYLLGNNCLTTCKDYFRDQSDFPNRQFGTLRTHMPSSCLPSCVGATLGFSKAVGHALMSYSHPLRKSVYYNKD